MNSDNPNLLLAVAGQALWCRAMLESGWRYGQTFDEFKRLHDALVPFDSLPPRDQRQVLQAVRALDIEPILARAIRHDRGPDREFDIDEMKVGLPVRLAHQTHDSTRPLQGRNTGRHATNAKTQPGRKAVPHPPTGSIESWETDRDGQLTAIRVRWCDGSTSQHHPAERELARPL